MVHRPRARVPDFGRRLGAARLAVLGGRAPPTGDGDRHSRSSRRRGVARSRARSPTDRARRRAENEGRGDGSTGRSGATTRRSAWRASRHSGDLAGGTTGRSTASSRPSWRRRDEAVKRGGELDRLAPRPGPRLPPLLGHPSSVVRFYAVRLLSPLPTLAGQHVPACTIGPLAERPRGRARDAAQPRLASGERCAARFACSRTRIRSRARAGLPDAAAVSASARPRPSSSRSSSDTSWWVREAAREALVAAGTTRPSSLEPALDEPRPRRCAAAPRSCSRTSGSSTTSSRDERGLPALERILDAGGRGLRGAAAERAGSGLRLGVSRARGGALRDVRDRSSSACVLTCAAYLCSLYGDVLRAHGRRARRDPTAAAGAPGGRRRTRSSTPGSPRA